MHMPPPLPLDKAVARNALLLLPGPLQATQQQRAAARGGAAAVQTRESPQAGARPARRGDAGVPLLTGWARYTAAACECRVGMYCSEVL